MNIYTFIHSRGFAWLVSLMVLAGAAGVYLTGDYVHVAGDRGFALPSSNEWISPGFPDFAAGICANAAIIVLMTLTNRIFNNLRSSTMIYVSFFAMMQLASPGLLVQFYSGPMMCLTVLFCTMLLFSCYRSPGATRRIFLIFFILSAGVSTQYCFAVNIPVFLLGCAQMRIFNLRTIVAALLGIINPRWLLLGFGVVSFDDIHLPEIVNVFSDFTVGDTFLLVAAAGVSALTAVVCFVLGAMKAIAYNARSRAYNGFLAVLTFAVIAAILADYRNLPAYIPLLNLCAAFQAAHIFSLRRGARSAYSAAGIMAVYLCIYLCQTVI